LPERRDSFENLSHRAGAGVAASSEMGDTWDRPVCSSLFPACRHPRIVGIVPDTLVDASIFPLIFIPVSFGYAIQRYRLMDVDINFQAWRDVHLGNGLCDRPLCHPCGDCRRTAGIGFEPAGTVPGLLQTIVAALVFAPIKDQFQICWIILLSGSLWSPAHSDRFWTDTGSEVRSENMLGLIVDRLCRALSVDRAAIFLEIRKMQTPLIPRSCRVCDSRIRTLIPQGMDGSGVSVFQKKMFSG